MTIASADAERPTGRHDLAERLIMVADADPEALSGPFHLGRELRAIRPNGEVCPAWFAYALDVAVSDHRFAGPVRPSKVRAIGNLLRDAAAVDEAGWQRTRAIVEGYYQPLPDDGGGLHWLEANGRDG